MYVNPQERYKSCGFTLIIKAYNKLVLSIVVFNRYERYNDR